MTGDISKKTVAVLVVLALILSLSLTLVSLKTEYKLVQKEAPKNIQSAQVVLNVEAPKESITGADVALKVVDR